MSMTTNNPPHEMVIPKKGPQSPKGPESSSGADPTPRGRHLTIEEIGAAMRRSRSGPALALAHYFDNPNGQRLEQLTRAVLYDFGRATIEWEVFAGDVLAAAKDSRNHPTGCACDRCGSEGRSRRAASGHSTRVARPTRCGGSPRPIGTLRQSRCPHAKWGRCAPKGNEWRGTLMDRRNPHES